MRAWSAECEHGVQRQRRVVEVNSLLQGQEEEVGVDAGRHGGDKRPDARGGVRWRIAMRPSRRCKLDHSDPVQRVTDELERIKARIRAKVEHPFRVIKRPFGHVKVCYRGLVKNTAQLHMLLTLTNRWMARRKQARFGA